MYYLPKAAAPAKRVDNRKAVFMIVNRVYRMDLRNGVVVVPSERRDSFHLMGVARWRVLKWQRRTCEEIPWR
jgi:hypothetical protein